MNKIKFSCDVMLGHLAKYLRYLGYDTFYSNDISDDKLYLISLREGRILLSCDHHFLNKKSCYILPQENLENLLLTINKEFKIFNDIEFNKYCLICNQPLNIIFDKETIKSELPIYIFINNEHFKQCMHCKRIYWHGTHMSNMEKKVMELIIKSQSLTP